MDIAVNFPTMLGGPIADLITQLIGNASPQITLNGSYAVGSGNILFPNTARTLILVAAPLNVGSMRFGSGFYVGTSGPTVVTLPAGASNLLGYTVPASLPFTYSAQVIF